MLSPIHSSYKSRKSALTPFAWKILLTGLTVLVASLWALYQVVIRNG